MITTISQGKEIRDQLVRNNEIVDCMKIVKEWIQDSGYRKYNLISELDTFIDDIEDSQLLLEKTFPASHNNFLILTAFRETLNDEDRAEIAFDWCERNADQIVQSWKEIYKQFDEATKDEFITSGDDRDEWIRDVASDELDMDIFAFQGEFLSSVGYSGATEENDLKHLASIWLSYKFDGYVKPEFGGREEI
tara:strand:+ start:173 stop:748 length:576 start_codon:yes stop_codon:yes gene_type:complete